MDDCMFVPSARDVRQTSCHHVLDSIVIGNSWIGSNLLQAYREKRLTIHPTLREQAAAPALIGRTRKDSPLGHSTAS